MEKLTIEEAYEKLDAMTGRITKELQAFHDETGLHVDITIDRVDITELGSSRMRLLYTVTGEAKYRRRR